MKIKHSIIGSKGKSYTYLTILTIDGISLCMYDKGETLMPRELTCPMKEWTILINVKSV